jgi:hypothetical protein
MGPVKSGNLAAVRRQRMDRDEAGNALPASSHFAAGRFFAGASGPVRGRRP